MVESARLGLPLLVPGQGQKDITHNEALLTLDMLVQPAVTSATLAAPPAEPPVGACWLVPAGAAGAWSGRDGCVAMWSSGGWRFAIPAEGWTTWVSDTAVAVRREGGGWVPVRGFPDPAPSVVEPAGGAVIDIEARNAIASILASLTGLGLLGA